MVHLAHLEEEDTRSNKYEESDDPGGIKGVTKEFMVHLARAVRMPKWRNAAIIVAAQNISSATVHL